jgi:hypothetical protein
MPSVRAIAYFAVCAMAVGVSACEITNAPTREEFLRIPNEIRTGATDTVVAPVERDVSRDEIDRAVRTMLSDSPICLAWPSLWLNEGASRADYVVRSDLMARDWGENVAGEGEQRERPEIATRVHQYSLTPAGRGYLRGSPYGGDRPSFCAPSQRQLIEITNIEFGQYPCGTLRVSFTYTAQSWPSWASSDAARTRVAADLGAIGAVEHGVVTLGRQWFSQTALPEGRSNGSLQSVCYDAQYQRVTGSDLNLHAQASSQSGS